MRLALSVLGFFLAYVAATTYEDHPALYGVYPFYLNPYYSPNRLAVDDALRTIALGMGGGFTAALPRPTVTYIKVLTEKVTCSMSVSNRCRARQASPSRELEQLARPEQPSSASTSER
jgi:hypothetical protein